MFSRLYGQRGSQKVPSEICAIMLRRTGVEELDSAAEAEQCQLSLDVKIRSDIGYATILQKKNIYRAIVMGASRKTENKSEMD